jgi:hypothetical protein
MEVSGQLHTPATLSWGKTPQYPMEWRLGGPQGQYGCNDKEKNPFPAPAGNQTTTLTIAYNTALHSIQQVTDEM